jgi:mitochondrial fission protein ELM1
MAGFPPDARAWLITDDKIGMLAQCRGVAEALGLAHVEKRVKPVGLARLLSPWSRPARSERFGEAGAVFAPPWPTMAIASGRLSIPYLRAISHCAGRETFTVVLQDPKTGLGTADVIWVPEHDRLRGANVITTLTAPHRFSPQRLDELRRALPSAIAALPPPRVAIVLGGPSKGGDFTHAEPARLAGALRSLAVLGSSFLLTPSRRTPPALLAAAEAATRSRPRILWTGEGTNPYDLFLAHADVLVVTGDSVNMTSEACATGRPVYVFMPSRLPVKLLRFHEALRRYGATRPLPNHVTSLVTWSYRPLYSAAEIAAEIERRWQMRQPALCRG